MRTAWKIALALILLLVPLLFNRELVDFRMEELSHLLDRAAAIENIPNAAGILGKYELIRSRLEKGETESEIYRSEARAQILAAFDQIVLSDEPARTAGFHVLPVRPVVNGIRRVVGKEIIDTEREEQRLSMLQAGYLLERNRRYEPAIEQYERALEIGIEDEEIRATVLLHKAFCLSMSGRKDEAEIMLIAITVESPGTEAGIIAHRLLAFLTELENRRLKQPTEGLSELELGKRAYYLVEYREAIEHLSRFLDTHINDEREPEARYYRGRSYEELGEVDEALRDYTRAELADWDGVWAREANRRKVMLGRFYGQGESLAQEAGDKLRAYGDEEFLDRLDDLEVMMEGSGLEDGLEDAGAAGGAEDTSLENPGQIVVRTDPPGAVVRLNGDVVGISPLVIRGAPPGRYEVRAETETKTGRAFVRLDGAETFTAEIPLIPKTGTIAVLGDAAERLVYLDGRPVELAGNTLEATAGSHTIRVLEAGSDGHSASWSGRVEVRHGRTTTVEPRLSPYGAVAYRMPEGAEAAVSGEGFERMLTGRGFLDFIPAGDYRVTVSGPGYRAVRERLTVEPAAVAYLRPRLQTLEEWKQARAAEERRRRLLAKTREELERRLDGLDETLDGGGRIEEHHLVLSEQLVRDIEGAEHPFPELEDRATTLHRRLLRRRESQDVEDRLSGLYRERDALEDSLSSAHDTRRGYTIGGWISLGVGLGSLGGMSYSLYQGNQSYREYLDATTAEDAVALREETERYQTATLITGIVGGVGITTFTLLQLLKPRPTGLQQERRRLEAEIDRLERRQEELEREAEE